MIDVVGPRQGLQCEPETSELKRGLSINEAANYCGITSSAYRNWMDRGLVPRPWAQTRRVDRVALDEALDKMSGRITDDENNADFEHWEAVLDGDVT